MSGFYKKKKNFDNHELTAAGSHQTSSEVE